MGLWRQAAVSAEGNRRLVDRYARALDPSTLESEMERAMREGEIGTLDIEGIRTRSQKLELSRYVVSVDVRTQEGDSVKLIVKGYWDDRARQIIDNHRKVWGAGFGESDPVRTARPWGLIEPLGAMVMERLPGKSAAETDVEAAALAGEAVARLHSSDAGLLPDGDLRIEIEGLMRGASRLAEREPARGRGRSVLEAAERASNLQELADVNGHTPIHGDLGNNAFRVSGGRIYVFDWDTSCSFDPAWDVGYYLAYLQRWALKNGTDTAESQQRFLDVYLGLTEDPSLERRARYFEALVYLKKAVFVQSDWIPVLVPWAEQRLTEVEAGRRDRHPPLRLPPGIRKAEELEEKIERLGKELGAREQELEAATSEARAERRKLGARIQELESERAEYRARLDEFYESRAFKVIGPLWRARARKSGDAHE